MPTTEHTINDALAEALRQTRRAWYGSDVVSSENTRMLKHNNRRPDILVMEASVSPVAIETEVLPAHSVAEDASSRLGEQVRGTGRTILSSIAVCLPPRLRSKHGASLKRELDSATDLRMAVYTGSSPSSGARWPNAGWLVGSVADLSVITQSASVPPDVIRRAADELVQGVSEAAGLIEELSRTHAGALNRINKELRQADGAQTRRMAATILANAFVFQESLAGGPRELSNVRTLEELRSASGHIAKHGVLAEWRRILKVNYWPIFDIARRILEVIPTGASGDLLERLSQTAGRLLENRLMRSHDLTGAVFQQLIVDRKFLAAYYTTPASAALLAGLSITRARPPAGGAWASSDDVKTFRIADFACGTGTLLSTAYQRVGQLHELAGGSFESIHPAMMADSLIGCDVLPAAAHLTASMVSGTHPTIMYKDSAILTVAYGKQPDGTFALGSLDLLDPKRKFGVLAVTAKVAGGGGRAGTGRGSALAHGSFDLVLMNPPFTRATSHEGDRKDVVNPVFAAFQMSPTDQKSMARVTKRLTAGTTAHGNAGEASIFLVLADRMLKKDGVLGLVMPLSLMLGESWEDSRGLLRNEYTDLVIVSIAGANGAELSFSADTDMAECLIVGRKQRSADARARFVVLNDRPPFPLLGTAAASQINNLLATKDIRALEDGPVGGTPLYFGEDEIGQVIEATLPVAGGWNLARIRDLSLAQAAFQLVENNRIWLPGMRESDAIRVPLTDVESIARIGPIHRDINGKTRTGKIRGPFNIAATKRSTVPTYPVLWAHDAQSQKSMLFDADCEGRPLRGASSKEQTDINDKIHAIVSSASNCHCNLDFRFNSQSIGMQFTSKRTIGGRAWISVRLGSVKREKALVLWANTTFGILLHWWHANKQQPGRGSIGKSTLRSLPTLNVNALSATQLANAVRQFDAMCGLDLLPIHLIDADPIRRDLDNAFARDVLNLPRSICRPDGALESLRRKLAREPSIRGQK